LVVEVVEGRKTEIVIPLERPITVSGQVIWATAQEPPAVNGLLSNGNLLNGWLNGTLNGSKNGSLNGSLNGQATSNGIPGTGIRGVKVIITSINADSSFKAFAITDERGRFYFTDLAPGDYMIYIDTATLPKRSQPAGDNGTRITLHPGEQRTVELEVVPVTLPVDITFIAEAENNMSLDKQ